MQRAVRIRACGSGRHRLVLDNRPHLPPLSARLAGTALAAALALAACGSSKPGWERALPCLKEHSAAAIDTGRPGTLPFQSKEPPYFRRLTAPKSFERELDLSFRTDQPGANGLQLLFYSSEESPQRVMARLDHSIQAISTQGAYFPGASIERVGKQILFWSSRPTTAQRGAVVGCLD